MAKCSFKPYEGTEKYIFVSYAHRDSDQVFGIIDRMAQDGYRIWYDAGIEPGAEWSESIAQHMNNCELCIPFLSPRYLASHNCRQEVMFALSRKKKILSIALEPIKMPLGLEMQLSVTQFIMKHTLNSEEEFFSKLYSAHILDGCFSPPAQDKKETHYWVSPEAPEGIQEPSPLAPISAGGDVRSLNAADFGQLLKDRPEILDDVTSLTTSLLEIYPTEKGNIHVIVTAYHAGIVSLLRENGKAGFPAERVTNLLMEDYGLAETKARWAVELWRDAFPYPKAKVESVPSFGAAPAGLDEAVWRGAHYGSPVAQYTLGNCYYFGKGVPQNYTEAVKWFWQAAKQGNAAAQYHLGDCYAHGSGIQKNITEAVKWFMKAAEQGVVPAQANLGICYMIGQGVAQNYAEAVKWLHMAAQKQNASAQYNLGECYSSGRGVAQNYTEAVKWWRESAEQGNAAAQFKLGECYSLGRGGLPRNPVEATKWYQLSAQQGVVAAQRALGNCYYYGKGVQQDYTMAAQWFRKAAEQGNTSAQANLGVCYMSGHGVRQDFEEAVKWFRKAAEQGVASAQTNLGLCYAQGRGIAQNHTYAAQWFRRAALQGDASAQTNLGVCYLKGQGVPKDKKEAEKWLQMAQQQRKERGT